MKSLVVYFSVYGSTKVFAEEIAKQAGSNIARIEPVVEYDTNTAHYEELAKYAKKEHDENQRPAIKNEINIAEYDTIFIGYPMWWYTMPMIMYTFFEKYDFTLIYKNFLKEILFWPRLKYSCLVYLYFCAIIFINIFSRKF